MLRKKANLYYSGLVLMAIGLPVSEFLMSISVMILALAWLVNGPKKLQWQSVVKNKLVWSGLILFFIPLISMLWTDDYAYSLHDLRIKLPLLLVPFFVASYSISEKQFHVLLALLIGSTFVGSIIIFINYYLNLEGSLENIRDVSIFISHIRFSLIIDICIFILIYAVFQLKNYYSIIAIAMLIWFVYFIFFLGSGNGFIGLLSIIIFGLVYLLIKFPNMKIKYGVLVLFLLYCSYIFYLSFSSYTSHFVVKDDPYNKSIIDDDNRYYSLANDYQLVNGFYIWRNIANKQIKTEWKSVSAKEYYEKDVKGQAIQGTIIRYLTSRGLSKDSVGIHQLSEQDVLNIQNGQANYKQQEWNNLQFRIDQFFYQMMAFYYKRDPDNKPILQRLFYWKGAINIINENPILGVGGDIQHEFNSYFESETSELAHQYWHHSHNQYLTYFVVGGILGFLGFLWAVFYPFRIYLKENLILTMAQLVMLISFITEDTLETQPGVTMYVLFLALGITLLNGRKKDLDQVDVLNH